MAKTKKLCFMAVLTAIALTIFMIENQLPSPVPIPGIKLGLANIITLTAMAILGRKEAGAILAARIIRRDIRGQPFDVHIQRRRGNTGVYRDVRDDRAV